MAASGEPKTKSKARAKASTAKKRSKKSTSSSTNKRSSAASSAETKKTRTTGKTKSAKHDANKSKHLVIVESPAKAKTINKYLGSDFVVQASVGHIRDLPEKSPKELKQPVPGVDLENNFKPTYVILPAKAKTVTELKSLAKNAADVWFATDLDREGEAIAWHLSQILGIEPAKAKRVVFNAITQSAIDHAFASPRPINEDKVNAQQARRILDRIVGYQASPLLWKKVARGLSAGRVQSVAVRLIVEREREIDAFVPDERWQVIVRLCDKVDVAQQLYQAWKEWLGGQSDDSRTPTLKQQNAWMAEHGGIKAELVELAGHKFSITCSAKEPRDLLPEVHRAAVEVGLTDIQTTTTENPKGKGPATYLRTLTGVPAPKLRYRVRQIDTKQTTSRPPAPFITSSLQIAAANQLGFSAQRAMRTAQSLYEGVHIPDEGQVGLITYMRTDSTYLSSEAIQQIRGYISDDLGSSYLPSKANIYSSSNKDAQEAHEAIRPTEVHRHPESLRSTLTDEQYKLYQLIWNRTVASQMTPAVWDVTNIFFERADKPTGAVLKASGRILAFDGFYRIAGVPTASDEQTLPAMEQNQQLGVFSIESEQKFSSPPPRYSEASLVKTLESEGIGRPSTYASIIQVIQDRKYVEQLDRRFHATDLGEVVTDKLVEAFSELMNVGYTREMEAELDKIEEQGADWQQMLHQFYGKFSASLANAHEQLSHAKAETQPAIYKCPKCGARTCYRFGKNGRFLSCSTYPECDYASPINRAGQPLLPEHVDIISPEDGSEMQLRSSRFGAFIVSANYPASKFVINLDKKGNIKYPVVPPLATDVKCPKCDASLNLRMGKRGPWLGCSRFPKCRGRVAWSSLPEDKQKVLAAELEAHEKANPRPELRRRDGTLIPEGTPVSNLIIPGGVAELEIHPDFLQSTPAKST